MFIETNRKADTITEKEIDIFLNKFFYFKEYKRVKPVYEKEKQIAGIDVIVDNMFIDNKAQSSANYINKPTKTFILELLVHSIKNGQYIGWFLNPNLQTTHYCFVWIHDANVHPGAMIRKYVLEDNNIRYNEQYSPSEDYKLWCDLIDVTNFYNIPEVLFNYRNHRENTSNTQCNKMKKVTFDIWAENEFKYPVLWKKYNLTEAKSIKKIRLLNYIPFLKIEQKGEKSKWLLFDFIPLFTIKNKSK